MGGMKLHTMRELWSLDFESDQEQEAREEATALRMRRAGKCWKQIGAALHMSLQEAQAVYDRALERALCKLGGTVTTRRPPAVRRPPVRRQGCAAPGYSNPFADSETPRERALRFLLVAPCRPPAELRLVTDRPSPTPPPDLCSLVARRRLLS
jgi:hypothetical protein